MILDCLDSLVKFTVKPLDRQLIDIALLKRRINSPSLHEAERVPDLVAEIPALLHLRLVVEDVVAGRGAKEHSYPHGIGAVLGYKVKRIRGVAESLGHLPAQFVTHDSGEIDVPERNVVHELLSGHDHPRHPEEDDVGTRNQVICRIIVSKILVWLVVRMPRLLRVEDRDRPQPA